jgi:hypothetical protein
MTAHCCKVRVAGSNCAGLVKQSVNSHVTLDLFSLHVLQDGRHTMFACYVIDGSNC